MLQYILGGFGESDSYWYTLLTSRIVEVWAAPVVGVLAVFVAALNVWKMRQQIRSAENEAKIRHLIDAALRAEIGMKQNLDNHQAPRPEVIRAAVTHFTRTGMWKYGEEHSSLVDSSTREVYLSSEQRATRENNDWVFPFNSDIVYLHWLLEHDRSETLHKYRIVGDDFYGLRSGLNSISAFWLHYLLLVREAVELGFSKETAGVMMLPWTTVAEVCYSLGAIADEELDLFEVMVEGSHRLTEHIKR